MSAQVGGKGEGQNRRTNGTAGTDGTGTDGTGTELNGNGAERERVERNGTQRPYSGKKRLIAFFTEPDDLIWPVSQGNHQKSGT